MAKLTPEQILEKAEDEMAAALKAAERAWKKSGVDVGSRDCYPTAIATTAGEIYKVTRTTDH